MRQKYFIQPFGNAGDITPAIPDAADATGLVSYSAGWTFDYQRLLGTDSAAKEIQRVTLNAAFCDVTTALQALQQQGVPEFITAAQNGGVAFPYRLRALVAYSASGAPPFNVYQNIVDNNTGVPGDSSNSWSLILADHYPLLDGNNAFTGSNGFSQSPTVPAGTTGNQAINFTQLSAETTARASADGTLQANINQEATWRTNTDVSLQSQITYEVTARETADNILQTGINNEATARNNSDITLSAAISSEATARANADNLLVKYTDFLQQLGGTPQGSYLYEKFPDGTIIQVYYGINSTGAEFIVFPNAFPNQCSEVFAIEGAPQGWNGNLPTIMGTQNLSASQFALYVSKWNGSAWGLTGGITYRYFAIGN